MIRVLCSLFILSLPLIAHATPHAYSDETCLVRVNHQKIEFYSDAFDRRFVVQGEQDGLLDLNALYVSRGQRLDPNTMDLALETVRETRKAPRKVRDGCYQGRTGFVQRDVIVRMISQTAATDLDLRRGQKLRLVCQTTQLTMSESCLAPAGGREP